jgi:hypothetical protein
MSTLSKYIGALLGSEFNSTAEKNSKNLYIDIESGMSLSILFIVEMKKLDLGYLRAKCLMTNGSINVCNMEFRTRIDMSLSLMMWFNVNFSIMSAAFLAISNNTC